MKVLILSGGKGTRMGEETVVKPKPLVEIGGKPIIWHIMKIYSHNGFNDFVLLLGYKGELIQEYFENSNEEGWNIQFIDTGLDSSKAQRIKQAEKLIDEDYFFVAYGDDLSDINPKEVLDFHKNHGKIVSLAAIPLESNFGVVEIESNNDVLRFREKPKIEGYWINGGFFCFSKQLFSFLNDKEELEDEVFKYLATKGEIKAFKHDGFWKCMNTKKETLEFNKLVEQGEAPWVKW